MSVALVPICQTRRPSAKTLRCGAELAGNRNGRSLAAPKDIDLTGLGQVLPEEVPRTILVGRRTDEIVRADRPAPGPRVPRASPRGGVVASSATGATSSDLFLSVGGEFRFD